MAVVIYTMEQLGILQPLQIGLTSVVIISLFVYLIKHG